MQRPASWAARRRRRLRFSANEPIPSPSCCCLRGFKIQIPLYVFELLSDCYIDKVLNNCRLRPPAHCRPTLCHPPWAKQPGDSALHSKPSVPSVSRLTWHIMLCTGQSSAAIQQSAVTLTGGTRFCTSACA